MNISKFLKNLNYYLGVKIFKKDNLFTYSLYTYFLNTFIKKKITDSATKNLFDNGFIDIKEIDKEFIKDINFELSKEILDDNDPLIIKFKITDNLKTYLKKFVTLKTNYSLNILKKLFKCNVYITTIQIRRTYNIDKEKFKDKSIYSENFHCDKYVGTHYKQFIYLNDVNDSNGPFTYLTKSGTKKFVKMFDFKNRFTNDIVKGDYTDYENYFLGKAGSSILVNTTECLHRAGIPHKGKYRDVIVITYVASPEISDPDPLYFEKKFQQTFWDSEHEGIFSKKLAKFKNNKQAIKNLFRHINLVKKFNDNSYSS